VIFKNRNEKSRIMNEVIEVLNRWRPNDKAMQRCIINEILKSLGNITDFIWSNKILEKALLTP
jgi:hypothetical protein